MTEATETQKPGGGLSRKGQIYLAEERLLQTHAQKFLPFSSSGVTLWGKRLLFGKTPWQKKDEAMAKLMRGWYRAVVLPKLCQLEESENDVDPVIKTPDEDITTFYAKPFFIKHQFRPLSNQEVLANSIQINENIPHEKMK